MNLDNLKMCHQDTPAIPEMLCHKYHQHDKDPVRIFPVATYTLAVGLYITILALLIINY